MIYQESHTLAPNYQIEPGLESSDVESVMALTTPPVGKNMNSLPRHQNTLVASMCDEK